MFQRIQANGKGARETLAASLSVLLFLGSAAPSLCLCRCVHAAPTPTCHHQASATPQRAAHPCEHACATMGADRSADLVAQPSAPDAASGSTPAMLAAIWTPPAEIRQLERIERDIGPPLPPPLFQVLRS